MDFNLSEEHRLVRDAARDVLKPFVAKKAHYREMIMKRREFPEEVWRALSEAGFHGCLIPPEHGGTGAGMLAFAIVCETLAEYGFGNPLMILTAMDGQCILKHGSAELKARFLPRIARGEVKLCFALTEPNAGSNTFRLETLATRQADGTFRVRGQKTYITGANVADYALLVVRTMPLAEVEAQRLPKAYGVSLLLVDLKAPGVTLRMLPMRGIEGMNQYELFFDDAEVPADMLVGQEHGGMMSLFMSLNPERILAAATACGMTTHLLEQSVAYAKDRKVFKGRAIGEYQAIQHPLALVRIELEATRLLVHKAAWAWDKGLPPGEVGTLANMAKYKAAELAIMAADRAVQTHGGAGFSEEVGIVYYWDAARLLRTAPVSNEMVLNYIAEHTLGLPRSY